SKRLLLLIHLRLASEEQAARFLGQYSEALEKKHDQRTKLFRRPNFFSFDTPDGGVFLRCFQKECVSLEGGDRVLFIKINKELNWGPVPDRPDELGNRPEKTATMRRHTPLVAVFERAGQGIE